MKDSNSHINYSFTDIERYLNGDMTALEMHDIERAALQDPFLADAIEGYRDTNKQTTEKNLNEITAAIQSNKEKTSVIAMPKRKNYSWQIAASVIVLISLSVLFLNKKTDTKSSATLASNEQKIEERKDTVTNNISQSNATVHKDSFIAMMPASPAVSKRKIQTTNKEKQSEKRAVTKIAAKPSLNEKSVAVGSLSADQSIALNQTMRYKQSQSSPAVTDTSNNKNAEVSVTGYGTQRRQSLPESTWTTDKGKPFILSEVEVINIGKKNKKMGDTSSIKPEGGWQLFREYLVGKLSKNDTLTFNNTAQFTGDLELEFSVGETGLPYGITVLHAQDSIMANKAVNAIRQGPKWISTGKKERRLNMKL